MFSMNAYSLSVAIPPEPFRTIPSELAVLGTVSTSTVSHELTAKFPHVPVGVP